MVPIRGSSRLQVPARGDHRRAEPARQAGGAAGVVAVLVGQHDAADPLEREPGELRPPLDLPGAEPGVDQSTANPSSSTAQQFPREPEPSTKSVLIPASPRR